MKPLTEFSQKNPKGKKPGLQPRCKPCATADTREWYQQHKEHAKNTALKGKYGISLEKYYQMLDDQDNKCMICETTFGTKKCGPDSPVVDHCHATGRVRGLLCNECNRGLGYFHDDINALAKAVTYLKRDK